MSSGFFFSEKFDCFCSDHFFMHDKMHVIPFLMAEMALYTLSIY